MIPNERFWRWVSKQPINHTPRGHFIKDVVSWMKEDPNWAPDLMYDAVKRGDDRAWDQLLTLVLEYNESRLPNQAAAS